jgi:GNAT superfamily N-acetyltransferase
MQGKLGAPRPARAELGSLRVVQVSGRRERNVFLRFPWQIYGDDPNWVPPLLWERKAFIDPRKHPFYHHGSAVQYLAYRGHEAAGRILVSDDPRYNQEHGTNLGCFGMFESVDDPAVAAALLEAAACWLRSRGRDAMMGPIDYSTNYACGLLIEGFSTPPRVLMNHNPPYYAGLLEGWGLVKAKDLYSWWFDDAYNMLRRWKRRAQRLAERGNISVRQFRIDDLDGEVRRSKAIYNGAWERNWGFVKMTDAEFDYLVKELAELALPGLLLLAEIDGKPVGFSMTLPDFNEAIRPLDGRLFRWGLPLGWFQFKRNCRRIQTARLLILGVLEGYRRRGIAELLILRTLDYGKNVAHYTGAELGWTLEDNELINRTIRAVGGHHYKTYRIYQRTI